MNETAYQMLLSPDWNNVETAMLLLMSQPDTVQRDYLSRLLFECTMDCYNRANADIEDDYGNPEEFFDEGISYGCDYHGWHVCIEGEAYRNAKVVIYHEAAEEYEFIYYIDIDNVDVEFSDGWVPSTIALHAPVLTSFEEDYKNKIVLGYGYLQSNWMNFMASPKLFITLP